MATKQKLIKIIFGTCDDRNPGVLILRLFAGIAMMTHGYGKLFGGLEGFTENVAGMGFPLPAFFAFMAAFSEFFGALLLTLGLATRVWALLLAVTMGVAAFVAHAGDPFAMRELALLYMAVWVFFLFKGAGNYSVDALIKD